jgi:hypothetical protein
MGWKDLIKSSEPSELVLPWFGYNKIHNAKRSWTIVGKLPPEHGWYRFNVQGGRDATLVSEEPLEHVYEWGEGQERLKGYLAGDRFIPEQSNATIDPKEIFNHTFPVYCVEVGLERFSRAVVIVDRENRLVYLYQECPDGPEESVTQAYQDRRPSVDHIRNVTPALDLAFRWVSLQRANKERREEALRKLREEEERKIVESERLQQLMKDAGSAVGRRALAVKDFDAAAKEALRVSGAEFLDARRSRNKNEMVVQYRFRKRHLECVVERDTLRIVDAGVCLTDHETGEKGDTWLSLESLPGVISEAMDIGKLVVWRHGEDDEDDYDD